MSQLQSDLPVRDDTELMLAYAAGDTGAFEHLYHQYRSGLMRFFSSGTGDHAISLELYQDTWARVIRHRHSYAATARFSTWIYTIARNCLTDHHRKNARYQHVEELSDDGPLPVENIELPLQPDEIAALTQRAAVLQRALMLLPESQREAILLRHIAGLTIADIGVVLQEKPETIKSRLRYAVARLRKEMRVGE